MSGKIVKLSQTEITQSPIKVLDSSTKQPAVIPELVIHQEVITEADSIRRRKITKDEPQVRIRVRANSKEWDRIKRAEDW